MILQSLDEHLAGRNWHSLLRTVAIESGNQWCMLQVGINQFEQGIETQTFRDDNVVFQQYLPTWGKPLKKTLETRYMGPPAVFTRYCSLNYNICA